MDCGGSPCSFSRYVSPSRRHVPTGGYFGTGVCSIPCSCAPPDVFFIFFLIVGDPAPGPFFPLSETSSSDGKPLFEFHQIRLPFRPDFVLLLISGPRPFSFSCLPFLSGRKIKAPDCFITPPTVSCFSTLYRETHSFSSPPLPSGSQVLFVGFGPSIQTPPCGFINHLFCTPRVSGILQPLLCSQRGLSPPFLSRTPDKFLTFFPFRLAFQLLFLVVPQRTPCALALVHVHTSSVFFFFVTGMRQRLRFVFNSSG